MKIKLINNGNLSYLFYLEKTGDYVKQTEKRALEDNELLSWQSKMKIIIKSDIVDITSTADKHWWQYMLRYGICY